MKTIKFKIKNDYGNFLNKILENIDNKDYKWNILDGEVFNNNGNKFFTKDFYSNKEFKELIEKECYLVFLHLNLFDNDELVIELKIIDNIFVEIKSKSDEIIDTVEKNAINNSFDDVEANDL